MRRHLITSLIIFAAVARAAIAAEPRLLSDPNKVEDSDRALVLIHGLLGSPAGSFGNWPAIIANDHSNLPNHRNLSDFAVYAVDYEADFATRSKLDDVAVGVARDLEASQIFRRHRHIWLVAHSMGGLVLKRTIALWKLGDKTALIDRVMAIGMLGVLSAGAPLADLAKRYGIGTIATTFGWNGELLKDLTTNSGSYLDELETNWMVIKYARSMAPERRITPIISCGFETKPEIDRGFWTGLLFYTLGIIFKQEDIDTIVPKLFTSSICDEKRGFPVKHTGLIKPASGNDSVHLWLRSLIEESIKAGGREQRVSITTAPLTDVIDPLNFNLADRLEFTNREWGPGNPERIVFADDKSKQVAARLVLRGGPFYGSTKLDAWQAAAVKNTCLRVDHTPNRMTVALDIKNELTECAGGASVCRGQTCN